MLQLLLLLLLSLPSGGKDGEKIEHTPEVLQRRAGHYQTQDHQTVGFYPKRWSCHFSPGCRLEAEKSVILFTVFCLFQGQRSRWTCDSLKVIILRWTYPVVFVCLCCLAFQLVFLVLHHVHPVPCVLVSVCVRWHVSHEPTHPHTRTHANTDTHIRSSVTHACTRHVMNRRARGSTRKLVVLTTRVCPVNESLIERPQRSHGK